MNNMIDNDDKETKKYLETVFYDNMTEEERIASVCIVMRALSKNADLGGSFRHFLYTIMKLEPDAYIPVWESGGQDIVNALDEFHARSNS